MQAQKVHEEMLEKKKLLETNVCRIEYLEIPLDVSTTPRAVSISTWKSIKIIMIVVNIIIININRIALIVNTIDVFILDAF